MHDLAATPTGAVKSATAIAIEIMILLNIDLRIAQVRPRVEATVQGFLLLLMLLLLRFWCVVACAVPSVSGGAHCIFPLRQPRTLSGLQPADFHLHFTSILRGSKL
jgi:hypothetical protein